MYFYCYDYVFLLYVYVWPTEGFPCFFLSYKANARVNPALFLIFMLLCVSFVLCRSVYCLCVYVYCTTATGWLPNCS